MKTIAFIPVRGGSKTIPFKNIKSLNGQPLIYWTLRALEKSLVDEIIIATDSEDIIKVCQNYPFSKSKMKIYKRDSINAQDDSSTESVMLEYIKKMKLAKDTIFILVQCTNPFIESNHIDEALELYKSIPILKGSVMSCTKPIRYIWDKENQFSLNYNYMKRPRKQDINNYENCCVEENGSFYISLVGLIKESANRINHPITFYEMPWYSIFEIDTKDDWDVAEFLMKKYKGSFV